MVPKHGIILKRGEEMELLIIIAKGRPTKEELKQIIDMICEGFYEGIDQPMGINWEVKIDYDYREELVRDN